MSRKIILVANTDWYLYNFRASLVKKLQSDGAEVVLVSPPGSYSSSFQGWGIRWVPWIVGRKSISPWQELKSIVALVRIYQLEQPDLIHHHTIKPVFYGTLAARLTGVSAIINSITGRGYVFLGSDFKARFLRFFVTPFYRILLRTSKVAVIFENQTDREFFIEQNLVKPEQTSLIESVGVDPDRFVPQPEPQGEIKVLLPARMLWDKGIGVFVDAVRLLQQQKVSARFILVGALDDGNPSAIPAEKINSWQAEGLVEWLGWQKNMEKVYADSHIVVLPSFHEGVPTVLIEAAACARPLVATDIPGCRAVITPEENGLLVPTQDADALAKALKRLIESPDLRWQMGEIARKRVLQKFTHHQVNEATNQIYERFM